MTFSHHWEHAFVDVYVVLLNVSFKLFPCMHAIRQLTFVLVSV
jgi:hypothetical protein